MTKAAAPARHGAKTFNFQRPTVYRGEANFPGRTDSITLVISNGVVTVHDPVSSSPGQGALSDKNIIIREEWQAPDGKKWRVYAETVSTGEVSGDVFAGSDIETYPAGTFHATQG